ncbi:MAG: hypothetical protein OXH59_11330 [Rhodospirillaceae bacterium]|nr:hypothetical protein [Rhodospirillaceae bacterium]
MLTPDDMPWLAIAAACFGTLLLIESYRIFKKTKDDDPATRGILREALEANSLELQSVRAAAEKVDMVPLGDDGTIFGKLPEGTNLVKLPDGTFRLAMPVRLSASIPLYAAGGSAEPTVMKADDDR